MVAKKGKRSTKSVKSLKTKSLTGKQAKNVKGGFIWFKSGVQDKWHPDGPPILPVNKITKW